MENSMYIGGGILVTILVIALIIFILRRLRVRALAGCCVQGL
jgi:hypothetical protein